MPTHTIKIHADGHATPASQHAFNNDTVSFTSDKGPWTVNFAAGTPFQGGTTNFSGGKGVTNGGTISGSINTTYKYTSCCTPDGQTLPVCKDPDIVIDSTPEPGHPPKGGPKK